jgi:hypothetical protein
MPHFELFWLTFNKKVHQNLFKLYLQIAPKGSKIVYICRQKIIKNYQLLGQNLSIMILENSSDYRDFDNEQEQGSHENNDTGKFV